MCGGDFGSGAGGGHAFWRLQCTPSRSDRGRVGRPGHRRTAGAHEARVVLGVAAGVTLMSALGAVAQDSLDFTKHTFAEAADGERVHTS